MKSIITLSLVVALCSVTVLASCPSSTTILTPTVAGWSCQSYCQHGVCCERTIDFDVKNCDSSSITFNSQQQSSCITYSGSSSGTLTIDNGGVFVSGNNLDAVSWLHVGGANSGCVDVTTTAGTGSICWSQTVSGSFNVSTGPATHCQSK
jgi:hypothetical protein